MADVGTVRLTDNSEQILRASDAAIQRALTAIGVKWQENVTPNVPVDTGRLRGSSDYDVDSEGKKVVVGFTAAYASFVELGTVRQRAQPYLKPSVFEHVNDYKQIVEDVLKNA